MEIIKCVIVDDEIIAAEFLAKSVRQIPQLELVKIFNDSIEAKEFLRNSDIFLVFLDIKMDGLSGIELAKIIQQKVVFTTGHDEFALASWKLVNVAGYLTKPIFFEDVVNVITERIIPLFSAEHLSAQFETDRFLHYKLDDELVKISHDNIVFIEANRNFSTIHLIDSRRNCPIPLWELEKILPKSKFVRINKATIANQAQIIDDSKQVLLLGGYTLKPGKAYREKIREAS